MPTVKKYRGQNTHIKVKYSSSFIRTVPSASELHRICTKLSLGSWAVTTGEELHLALKIFIGYILTLYALFVKGKISLKKRLHFIGACGIIAMLQIEAVSSKPS